MSLDRFERTTLEHAVRILMKEQGATDDGDLTGQRRMLCHEAAECIREILDPTYIRLI